MSSSVCRTCAFRHQDGEIEDARIVTGLHFCKNDNCSWKPCVYSFDLNNKKQADIGQKHLEIYCGIITENSHTLTERKEVEWEMWEKRGKNTIYKGKKEWDKFAEVDKQKIIFASLLYEKNNRTNQCSPVFVNVNPKRPIMLSFEKQEKKSHISFFTL
ncbi:3951_t:CDS:2 [Racocetra persica]|uniref:3951_t:CDS:1 n=1 Tax=Racocetra persica TaxID=160502 RepID=A0ACA9MLM5_9GLOM|nr:3951_t:CDS:2 [Racocetra persica]